MILVISLEGIESNTEVNFYNGLGDFCNSMIECAAVGQCSIKRKSQKCKFVERVNALILEKINIIKTLIMYFLLLMGIKKMQCHQF